MKEKLKELKKLIIPLLLFISISLNLLYFFNILNFRIFLIPPKAQEIQNQKMPNYIDSPPEYLKIIPNIDSPPEWSIKQDSLKRLK